MAEKSERMLSAREAVRRLGVSLDFLYRILWSGQLPGAQKVGSQWRIPAQAVEARLRKREKDNG